MPVSALRVPVGTCRYGGETDLSIPPPAKKGAVHYPCLNAYICKGRKVGLHQVGEDFLSLEVVEFMIGKPVRDSASHPASELT